VGHAASPAASGTATRGDLTRYWWGQTTSAFGTVFTVIALPIVAVVHLGAAPGQVALISAAGTLPTLLFGLPVGALADRITRPRRTLMTLDLVSALAVAAVAAGLAGHVASIGWLVGLSFTGGCVSIFVEVVYFVHLRQLTGPEGVSAARARLQAGQYAAGFLGRLAAGPVIVALGSAAALGVDAASYVLSALAMLSMAPVSPVHRAPAGSPAATLLGALTGLRLFAGDGFRRALTVFILVPAAALAGCGALVGPFLLRTVHVPVSAYGLAFALSGLMGLTGSVVAGRVRRARRSPRVLTLAAFTAGMIGNLLLPLAAGPLLIALPLAALGIGLPILFGAVANVTLSVVLTADIPEAVMGRALAAIQVFAGTAVLLGALAGGALGDWIGPRSALWVMDAVALAVSALLLPPSVRAGRRLDQAAAAADDLAGHSRS
jgi:MFS family permease